MRKYCAVEINDNECQPNEATVQTVATTSVIVTQQRVQMVARLGSMVTSAWMHVRQRALMVSVTEAVVSVVMDVCRAGMEIHVTNVCQG